MKTDLIKIIFTLLVGLSSCASNAQEGFIIEGKVTGDHEGKKVVLTYRDWPDNGPISDSVLIKNGSFVFKGKVNDFVRARLALKDKVEKKIRQAG